MTELDRVFDELAALREQTADTAATAARIEERIANFTHAAEERARKHSDRLKAIELEALARDKELEVEAIARDRALEFAAEQRSKALEARLTALETWRWILAGAWGALLTAWGVFQALKKD